MTSSGRRVFVVDDDEAVGVALQRLLRAAGFEVQIFSSAAAFLQNPPSEGAGCLVLDQRMPGVSGLDLQRTLDTTAFSVVFLTGHGDVPTSVEAMKAGAVDFLTKPIDDTRLIDAVARGLARSEAADAARRERAAFLARLARLTPRERQVGALVIQGLLNKQIAYELGTAEKTVKVHRARVMEKLGVGSVAELARLAERTHTLRIDDDATKAHTSARSTISPHDV